MKEKLEKTADYNKLMGEAEEAQHDYNDAQVEYNALKDMENRYWEEYNSLEARASQGDDQAKKRRNELMDYLRKLDPQVKEAKTKVEKYAEALEEVDTNALEASGAMGAIDGKLKNLNKTMDFTREGFDLMFNPDWDALRAAYDNGLVSIDELGSKYKTTADELYKHSKSLADSTVEGIETGLANGKKRLENTGGEIGEDIINSARDRLDINSPSKEFIKIGEFTVEGLEDGIDSKTKSLTDHVKSLAGKMISAFKEGLNRFDTAFSNIPEMAKSAFNSVLSLFEQFLSRITDGLNSTFLQINQLNRAFAESGGKNQSYTTWSPASKIAVPRLATGTVIPANYGEFLAVLGDNKREAEVVSPVSAMKQAFLEAMLESGIIGGSGEKEINLFIDGDKFFSWIVGKSNSYKKSHGNSPFQGVGI